MESGSSFGRVSNHSHSYSTMKQPEIESSGITEIDNGEYWPLSGKPYVDLILTKTGVKPSYSMYLPKKMRSELPSAGARAVPAVLTCGQKKWDMSYGGVKSGHKFCIEWRKFVDDNNLKEGDGLVFELVECSASKIEFRVQILSGDFPAELKPEDEEGANSDNPILLG
ncbi:B3 domain-containing protein Os06g0112300-like [Solanum pennellii]|uniref:TF-B3 domain-containing protein n=2 Tax=Solanum subgen. Lycopersicon TaxID=49274 RepID=A0A3Q7EI37_SOLLC|nr:B3 domain-containing protein Os06g0112300 [Solanum lycopersicum]XP_015072506.1 B3 domain-containing protein Os06g0112300-like [Solanum pennellii]